MKSWVITIVCITKLVVMAHGQTFEFPITEKSKAAFDNVFEQISKITEPNATVIIDLSGLTGAFELETIWLSKNSWRKDIARVIIKGPEDKSLIFQKMNKKSGIGVVFVIGEKNSSRTNTPVYELQNLIFDGIVSYDFDAGDQYRGSAAGGVVTVFNGYCEFTNCDFFDNWCKSNEGWAYGGSIFATNSTVNFAHCQFKGNLARGRKGQEDINYRSAGRGFGGAVYAVTCQLKFENCLFNDNTANGGYPYDNINGYGYGLSGGNGSGGAVCLEKSESEFLNCDFIGNVSQATQGESNPSFGGKAGDGGDAYGGGVSSVDHSKTTVRNSLLKENSAIAGDAGASLGAYGRKGQGLGGGLYADGTSQLLISSDCLFENNNSSNGQATGYQNQIVNNTKDVYGMVLPVEEGTAIHNWMTY